MISLKRNSKTGELVKATGITSQKFRIYTPYGSQTRKNDKELMPILILF